MPAGDGGELVGAVLARDAAAVFPLHRGDPASCATEIVSPVWVSEGSLYAARIKQGLDVEEHLSSVRDYFRRLPAEGLAAQR